MLLFKTFRGPGRLTQSYISAPLSFIKTKAYLRPADKPGKFSRKTCSAWYAFGMDIQTLFNEIVPAQAMQISPVEYTDRKLILSAPLEPNLNDKGTGFAGSISSMLVLAGWAVITIGLKEAGMDADVMVVKSETEFSAPAQSELRAEAVLEPAEMARVILELETRGRSRIIVQSQMEGCARMTASYAILSTVV